MSDLTDLLEGKFGTDPLAAVGAFMAKEWVNTQHLIEQAPAELQPAFQAVEDDAKTILVDAAQWGGTALSAYIAASGGGLASEVVNLLSGAFGGTSPTTAAGQTLTQGVTALIQGLVQHEISSFVNAQTISPAK